MQQPGNSYPPTPYRPPGSERTIALRPDGYTASVLQFLTKNTDLTIFLDGFAVDHLVFRRTFARNLLVFPCFIYVFLNVFAIIAHQPGKILCVF